MDAFGRGGPSRRVRGIDGDAQKIVLLKTNGPYSYRVFYKKKRKLFQKFNEVRDSAS